MNLAAVFLTIIPPSLAIAVESLNPIDNELLTDKAKREFSKYGEDVATDVASFASSAVEVAGLAPTFVACISSCFGVLHEFEDPFWPFVIYLVIFAFLVFFVLKFLSGQSYLELYERSLPVKFCGRQITLPCLGTETLSYFIYAANVIFILYVFTTYCVLEHPWKYVLG